LNHAHPAEIDGRIADLEALSRNPPELKTHTQGAQPRRCSDKVCHADMGRVGTSADGNALICRIPRGHADDNHQVAHDCQHHPAQDTSSPGL
jgi:hypothetical protein